MTRVISFCAAFVIAASLAAPSTAAAADDSLYRAFGEKAGIEALIDDFVQRLVVDPRTRPSFEKANLPHLKTTLTDQLCHLAGGPCQYGGRDMKSAHANMDIAKSDFNALVEVLQKSMDARRIPFRSQNQMLALLAPMHRDIITK
jgi:hemoglobin